MIDYTKRPRIDYTKRVPVNPRALSKGESINLRTGEKDK